MDSELSSIDRQTSAPATHSPTGKRFPLSRMVSGLTLFILWIVAMGVLLTLLFSPLNRVPEKIPVEAQALVRNWRIFSGNRPGKLVFAQPPHLIILNLRTGRRTQVPGVVVHGGPGRAGRGLTPRPSWSPAGDRFLFRDSGKVYVAGSRGIEKPVTHPEMATGRETRWSWHHEKGRDWAVGPARSGDIIMVNIDDSSQMVVLYSGVEVKWWCELTASGRFVVFDSGGEVYVHRRGSRRPAGKISRGQSCRPCAAPDDRVAWLPAPHIRYWIHDAASGKRVGALDAPPGEEIYRLNWSNHPDFAVHMFGSRGNDRIHVRRVGSGKALFVGHGWDPDLWVGPKGDS